MKLNPDKVRELLLELEENLKFNKFVNLTSSTTDSEKAYTATKLIEAGFLNGDVSRYPSGDFDITIDSITWNGHQFLDNIRPQPTWEKTIKLAKSVGGVSIGILSDTAAKIVSELINNKLGN